jgi:signal transduction histidine kinase
VAVKARSDSISERLAGILTRLGAPGADVRAAVAVAGKRTGGQEATALSLLKIVADVLGRLALEQSWSRPQLGKLVAILADAGRVRPDVVRLELQGRMARDPGLLEVSPAVAVEAQLRLFYALIPVRDVSIWSTGQLERLHCSFHVGAEKPARGARTLARRALGETSALISSGSNHALPVLRWQRPHAVIVFGVDAPASELVLAAARQTAAALAPILEREALLVANAARERALVGGGERLLARLGFDLHDGAIQDVAALATDVHLFRRQLRGALTESATSTGLLGRLDDLEARVVAVDDALRDVVHSLESPTRASRPVAESLRCELDAFAAHTGLRVDLSVRGDLTDLSDSQRIALLRIVQESLTNVREHSGAGTVTVSVAGRRGQTSVEVTDDGRGFDVERTLVRAAQRGRLGLVGMSERVRLLGGHFDVDSRPGGPTKISAVLPEWRPATAQPVAPEATLVSVG